MKAEVEQRVWRAKEEAHVVAKVEASKLEKEAERVIHQEMIAKDAEKQHLQEQAEAIHKAQHDFVNMKVRKARDNAKQVGLGTKEATRCVYIHNFPGVYKVVVSEALGSGRVACKHCQRGRDECVWPSGGKEKSCTKCMDRKVRCMPWKVQDGVQEPLEVLKDDREEETPKKGRSLLLKGKWKVREDSEEPEGV